MRTPHARIAAPMALLWAIAALLGAAGGAAGDSAHAPEENEVAAAPGINAGTQQKDIDVELTVRLVRERLRADPSLPRLSRARVLRLLDEVTGGRDAAVQRALAQTPLDDDDYDADLDLLPLRPPHAPRAQPPPSVALLPPLGDSPDDPGDGEDAAAAAARRQKALMLVLPFSATNLSAARISELYTRAPLTRIVDDGLTPTTRAQVVSTSSTTTTTTTTTTSTAAPTTRTSAATFSSTTSPSTPSPSHAASNAPSGSDAKFGSSYSVHGPTRIKVRRPLRKPAVSLNTSAPTSTFPTALPTTPTASATTAVPTTTPAALFHASFEGLEVGLGAGLGVEGERLPPTEASTGPVLYMTPAPEDKTSPPLKFASHYSADRLRTPPRAPAAAPAAATDPRAPTRVTQGASVAAPSLADDLQALLASWGLLPSEAPPPPPARSAPAAGAAYAAPAPSIDPTSYAGFKPLPDLPPLSGAAAPSPAAHSAPSGEMRDFLAAFGIVPDAGGRAQRGRSIKEPGNPLAFPAEALPPAERDILRRLGLLAGGAGREASGRAQRGMETPPAPQDPHRRKEHVFNPQQHLAALRPTPEEVKRLNKLLDTFKKYSKEQTALPAAEENTTPLDLIAEESEMSTAYPTEEETQAPQTPQPPQEPQDEAASAASQTEDVIPLHKAQAPSPLDLSELLLLLNATKTEAKRQQPETPSTSTSTSTAAPSSDMDAGAASVADLAASFGGDPLEEPSSTPPPSGLYFLVDWNSFLEVGDPDGEKRVNVRIAPKVGDARRFLPVTVP